MMKVSGRRISKWCSSSSLVLGSIIVIFFSVFQPEAILVQAYSIEGKRALVTGSSGGIGRGIASKLAQQGAHVMIHYHVRQQGAEETEKLIQAQAQNGGSCAGILQSDFRNPANIYRMFQEIDTIWNDGIDILVNNAGSITKQAIEDDDENLTSWRDTLEVNLNAPRLLSQLALERMKNRQLNSGGVIINVSSIHGEKSNEYMSAYAVSKAALDMLTRSMAIEFAQYNVRVNAIAPGVVVVERTAEIFNNPENVIPWTDRLLVNQLGSVKEIADATIPLITNDWITGTIWQIDGGMMARANFPIRERPPPPVCRD